MVFVTDLSAHCAHTYPIHHLTSVTVVPSERKKARKLLYNVSAIYLITKLHGHIYWTCIKVKEFAKLPNLFMDMDSLECYFFNGLLSLKL